MNGKTQQQIAYIGINGLLGTYNVPGGPDPLQDVIDGHSTHALEEVIRKGHFDAGFANAMLSFLALSDAHIEMPYVESSTFNKGDYQQFVTDRLCAVQVDK